MESPAGLVIPTLDVSTIHELAELADVPVGTLYDAALALAKRGRVRIVRPELPAFPKGTA